MSAKQKLSRSQELAQKVALVYAKRTQVAREEFSKRLAQAVEKNTPSTTEAFAAPARLWMDWHEYAVDAAQRTILFWDTLRQRGNNFVEHTKAGLPPVLHFDYETVLDGRTLAHPVNYALVKIVPPAGVTIDDALRCTGARTSSTAPAKVRQASAALRSLPESASGHHMPRWSRISRALSSTLTGHRRPCCPGRPSPS